MVHEIVVEWIIGLGVVILFIWIAPYLSHWNVIGEKATLEMTPKVKCGVTPMSILDDLATLNQVSDAAYADGFVEGLKSAHGIAVSGTNHAATLAVHSADWLSTKLELAAYLSREIGIYSKPEDRSVAQSSPRTDTDLLMIGMTDCELGRGGSGT